MTCLLPHFKCQPSSILHPTPFLRSRETVCFRTHCAVSTSPPPLTATETAKSDIEKLHLAYVRSNSSTLPIYGSLTYINPLGSPTEDKFDSTLMTETLIENEEATVAAAASKALALARAAAKVAKDAALMAGSGTSQPVLSEGQPLQLKGSQQSENEQLGNMRNFENPDNDLREGSLTQWSNFEPDDLEPSPEELLLLEAELAENIAVRSTRQVERKAKRARASEKGVSSGVPLKVGSSRRKKRTSVQEVDRNDPFRYFRRGTSFPKLLSASEETKLSAGIQELLRLEGVYDKLKEKYGKEPSVVQWSAAAGIDQRTLTTRIHQGTMCKDKMIKSNIRLVISIARNYQGTGMNIQDLIQEGCRGLIRGAEKFDASKGFKFSTYAHWWIKQSVRKSLSDQSRTIRLPFHMVDATYRVKEAKKKLFTEKGREPTDEEVAEATGLTLRRIHAVLVTPKAPRSLDQKLGLDMNLKPSEIISDPEAKTSEDLVMKEFMRQDLEKVIDGLSKKEGQVIRWRFGLEGGRTKTLQEIGELIGVSRERIRQIETSAFKKLKNKQTTQHLEQYLYS